MPSFVFVSLPLQAIGLSQFPFRPIEYGPEHIGGGCWG